MAVNINTINGKLNPIKNRVIVTNMHFGEKTTKAGLILRDDNGTDSGIYPRWAQVHAKGPENIEEYAVGDWVLVEHGRWTRGFNVDEGNNKLEIRMVEAESILMWSNEPPDQISVS